MPERRAVALVTGGRRGIGRGIAWALASGGFDVVINDIVQDSAVDETLAGIEGRGGRAEFVRGDIAAVEAHRALSMRVERARADRLRGQQRGCADASSRRSSRYTSRKL
jgi:NAD(P)-dependent dehydrogenase (short-subunit alcohol dehydrogenase family)